MQQKLTEALANAVEVMEALEAPSSQRNPVAQLRLMQASPTICADGFFSGSTCSVENLHILLLVVILCSAISVAGCLWWFTKDYEESRHGPLCPQLLVKQPGLKFKMTVDLTSCQPMEILADGVVLGKVIVSWAEKRIAEGPAGIILTLGLQNATGMPLAAVAIRSVKHKEDAVMLCRPGCIVFGFLDVPADPYQETSVFYRTGSKMLGVLEDHHSNLRAFSYLGIEVGKVNIDGDVFSGEIIPEVDAGLFLCSVLGRHVRHLILSEKLVMPAKEHQEAQPPPSMPTSDLSHVGEEKAGEKAEEPVDKRADGGNCTSPCICPRVPIS